MKYILAALALLTAVTSPALAAEKIFNGPTYHNVRIDNCASKSGPCGQSVAASFCKANGFKYAGKYSVSDTSTNTVFFGSFKPCDRRRCLPFDRIQCTDTPTFSAESSTDIGNVNP